MDISAHPIRCRLRTMERQETRHVMCEQSLAAPKPKYRRSYANFVHFLGPVVLYIDVMQLFPIQAA